MKRPGGVTPPSVPDSSIVPHNESQKHPGPSRPRPMMGRWRKETTSAETPEETVTEPIPVIAPLPQDEMRTSFNDASQAVDRQDATDSEVKPWWLTRRSDPAVAQSIEADKSFVQAEKGRRRYERAEARRFTQGTRNRRRRLLIGVAGGAVAVLLIVLTAYSPLLAVRTITVEGSSRVDAAAVATALDNQLGRPLTLVDFDEVRTTLATFPLIQSYVTEAQPPSTLVIRIIERRPVVSVAAEGGYSLVDAAGVVVETTPERAPGYPIIDVQATPVDTQGFTAASQVLLALTPEFLAQVDSVGAATPDSVTLVLGNGQRVVWGSSESSPLKARILASMISNPGLPDVSEYDVSSPEAPVTR